MNPLGPARYALWSAALCVAVAMGLMPLAFMFSLASVLWCLLGFWMMSVVAIVGGAWLVDRHGASGPAFPIAAATCILARLFVSVAGAGAAATRGIEAVYALLAGLGACYFPLMVFEMNWFLKRNKLQS